MVFLVAAVAGCQDSSLISEAQEKVSERLIDPDSAKFRNVKVVEKDGRKIVCGEVNAKNRMGGMVGYSPFSFISPDEVELTDTSDGFEYVSARAIRERCDMD